jgi:hypothetical protein
VRTHKSNPTVSSTSKEEGKIFRAFPNLLKSDMVVARRYLLENTMETILANT